MLLIFDLDGTLFQAKTSVLLAVRRLLDELGIPAPDENTILKNAGQGIDALLRNILPRGSALAVARMRALELMRKAVLECGELFPGVREAVIQLHNEGYELAICSNSPEEYIETVLEHTGIADAFSRYCSVSAYPSKASAIRELLQTEPPHCPPGCPTAIVIGDTHGDVEAAHENGLPAIAVTYGYGNKTMLDAAEYQAGTPMDIINCIHKIVT